MFSRRISAGVLCLAAFLGTARADDIVLLTGSVQHGTFQGYQNHKFAFLTADNRELKELASNVKSITLDRPTPASILPAYGKELEGVLFKGFARQDIEYVKDGEGMALNVTQVRRVALELDVNRVVPDGIAQVISTGAEVDVNQFV